MEAETEVRYNIRVSKGRNFLNITVAKLFLENRSLEWKMQ